MTSMGKPATGTALFPRDVYYFDAIPTNVDTLAVAEIMNDWQQMPYQNGDYVMY